MALRAVVFDYGMVLSGPPDPQAYAELLRIANLSAEEFEPLYWADRHDYDRGELTGMAFWHKLVADAGLSLSQDAIDELNAWDARMWTTENAAMLAWHKQLKEHGIRTAILSNMGDSVLVSIEKQFTWIHEFDHLIWSYQHNMAKPEAEIYRLVLDRLGVAAEETLFLDDRLVNIEAARALGIVGLEFTDIQKLRRDLIAQGLDAWLPLPAAN